MLSRTSVKTRTTIGATLVTSCLQVVVKQGKETQIRLGYVINRTRVLERALAFAGLFALVSCGQLDEEEMRTQLSQWFALGETLSFVSEQECAAGAFRLVDTQVGSAMPIVDNLPRAALVIADRGRVAYEDNNVSPDQAMIDMANRDRSLGMQMRQAGLEGRFCMDDTIETAFSYALVNPASILAFDTEMGALIILDPSQKVLVVAIGGQV